MPRSRSSSRAQPASPLVVRLDEESKTFLSEAAELRGVSISDYVRLVTVAQARREVQAAQEQTIRLAPAEQLAFWTALNEPPRLTASQRRLGRIMRGEA